MGAMTTSALLSPGSPPLLPARNQTGLFGIYDGHGGVEVAEFVSRNFEEAFRSSPYYKQMNYEMALQETFLRMDDLLMTPEGKMQIVEINKQNPANVSQLEKALVASGSLKGKVQNFLFILYIDTEN